MSNNITPKIEDDEFSLPRMTNGIVPEIILVTLAPFDKCRTCNDRLAKTAISFKYKNGNDISLKGHRCFRCNIFYLENSLEKDWLVSALAKSSLANKHIAFGDAFCTTECLQYKKIFDGNKSHHLLLILQSVSDDVLRPIIITVEKQITQKRNIYYYKDEKARKIVCSATRLRNREDQFKINGTIYTLLYSFERDITSREAIYNQPTPINTGLRITSLAIKKGGGFRTKNANEEVVAALVYSLLTCNCEIMYATYNKSTRSYYVDIGIFRDYVQKYGKPEVTFRSISNSSNYNNGGIFSLSPESFLHMYGYNVGAKDALTDSERSSILAEIIDLDYMSAYQIVRFLQGLISIRNPLIYSDAIKKWRTDIRFVRQYKRNPSRFVILEKQEKL